MSDSSWKSQKLCLILTNSKDFNIKYLHSIYIPIEVPPTLIHFASDADRQTKNEMNSFLCWGKIPVRLGIFLAWFKIFKVYVCAMIK